MIPIRAAKTSPGEEKARTNQNTPHMKRHVLAAITFCMALIYYSCSRELEQPTPVVDENMQEITINASLEGNASTRTIVHYDSENKKYNLLWEPGDKISLFYGSGTNGGQMFTSLNTEEAFTASFTGSINAITLGGEDMTMDDIYFWGVYPYRNDIVCDGSSITTTLPDVQTARAGSFDKELYISMGKSLGLNIGFLCACGGIRFRVSHSGITKIVFSGNNGEILAGKVKLGFGSDGKPKVMEVLDGKTSITLNSPPGSYFQPDTDYYIVTLPVQFTASMKMEFIQYDGNSAIRRWKTANIEIPRNYFKEYVNTPIDADQYATFMETVDLGLTSGTLWSTCNLGATSQEEVGFYRSWAELEPRSEDEDYCHPNPTIVDKYQYLTQIEPEDDVAYHLLGGDWRIPTKAQMEELMTECTWSADTENGVSGARVVGPNGNSVFIPYAGYIQVTQPINTSTQIRLWTSTRSDENGKAYNLSVKFNSDGSVKTLALDEWAFSYGMTIRPVRPKTHISFHEYVEMGDGLKWATCNVGAENPWDYGDYFAWGDADPKNSYIWDNYFDRIFYKYSASNYTRLWAMDDAAAMNWGGDWRMPTNVEWITLNDSNKFTWTRTSDYNGTGVKGMIVTSKIAGYEGRSIFLPAAGYKYGEEGYVGYGGIYGYYWSSDVNTGMADNAYDLYFWVDGYSYNHWDERYKGFSVRPVCD